MDEAAAWTFGRRRHQAEIGEPGVAFQHGAQECPAIHFRHDRAAEVEFSSFLAVRDGVASMVL